MGKKILLSTFMTLFIFLASLIPVEAAGASINSSTSTSQVVVGNYVTFTFKINSSQASYSMAYSVSYDSSKLSYVSGSGTSNAAMILNGEKSKTITLKFKAKASGNPTVKISGQICASNCLSFNGSKAVKIITQKEYEASKSSNNYLSSLSVEGATLSPSFNKNTTSYTVELPANTESINVKGSKADSRASVSGLGKHSVEDGKNTIRVSVVAENGSERVYTITANVKELDPIKVTVDNVEYTIVRKAKLLKEPNNTFASTEVEYKDVTLPGFINEKANLTLLGLKDNEGNISLFIYKDDEFIPYNEYSFSTLNIYIENKEIENNISKEELLLNDTKVNTYKLDSTSYHYFYGINLDTGEETIYRYDEQDKTIQRYLKEESKEEKTDKEDNTSLYKIIIVYLLGFIFLTYLVLLVIILSKGKKKSTKKMPVIEEGEVEVEEVKEEPEEDTEEMANILEDTTEIKKTSKKNTSKKKSTKKKGD